MRHQYLKNSSLKLNNFKHYDTSLMIPEKYIKIIRKKVNFHGSFKKYLHFLIINQVNNVNIESKFRYNVLTKYQDKGQLLVKFNFKPESMDWQSLKLIANHIGISISYLFVILLKLELGLLKKLEGKLGIPAKLPIFHSLMRLKFKKKNQYLLLSRFKIGL